MAWAFGLRFLRTAERLTAGETPEAAIHAGYYAMFHCARAVLIKRDGEAAPTKHGTVGSRFGYHAKGFGLPSRVARGEWRQGNVALTTPKVSDTKLQSP